MVARPVGSIHNCTPRAKTRSVSQVHDTPGQENIPTQKNLHPDVGNLQFSPNFKPIRSLKIVIVNVVDRENKHIP